MKHRIVMGCALLLLLWGNCGLGVLKAQDQSPLPENDPGAARPAIEAQSAGNSAQV